MNNQLLSIQAAHISQLGPHRNVLKQGASVYVKVIADKGNGVYEGSVAGNRVNITSSKGLNVGSSFVATISSKNGTIYITPKDSNSGISQQPFIQINQMENSQLFQLLSSLGVPVNHLSGNILKMMMMMELKVDSNVIRNIYTMASKHKGKEKAASELLIVLKEKGLNISQEELEELLIYLENINNNKADGQRQQEKSVINNVNKITGGWFIIPYNLVEIGTDELIGAGIIRIFYNKYNNLKIINLNCYFNNKEYLFSLSFENKKCKEIKFNINPSDKDQDVYENQLSTYFSCGEKLKISWCDASSIEGFGSEGKEIYSFNGEA